MATRDLPAETTDPEATRTALGKHALPSPFAVPLRTVLSAAKDLRVNLAGNLAPKTRALRERNLPAASALLKEAISFPAMLAALLVAAVFVSLRGFSLDPDVWWHVKVGAAILATHHWPTSDPYSFTASGAPWIAYEWLGDVVLAALRHAAGLRGLLVFDFAVGACVLLALYALASMRSRNSKAAFVATAIVLPLASVSFSARPQMLGYLFLVLTLILLERFRQGRTGTLWLLPPLFLAWVNTHGTFFVGLFAVGAYWLGGLVHVHWGGLHSKLWTARERLRLAMVFLLSLIALMLTPYGTRLAAYPLDMAFSQPINVANVEEWQSLPFNMFAGKLFLALIVVFLLPQTTTQVNWRLEEIALYLAGVVLACLHARFLLLFVPVFVPMLAVVLARWIPPYRRSVDHFVLNAVLMFSVVAGVVWFFPSQNHLEDLVAGQFPVRAVDYLREHPIPGRMYNNYGYGGYLIWAFDGKRKVFIDGRGDIYERSGVLSNYLGISRLAPNALLLLNAYDVRSCLIERNEPLGTLLAALPNWQEVYHDNLSAIFVRKSGTVAPQTIEPSQQ
jgi:hypothetical protein